MAWNAGAIRRDFPILKRRVRTPRGMKPLVYFDHGASTHAPRPVLREVNNLMENGYANIHRGYHALSRHSTDMFDAALATFLDFTHASRDGNVAVMTQNTTHALALAAHVMAGHEGKTLVTLMEHHSNDLPHRKRGDVLHANVDEFGRVLLDDVEDKLAAHDVKLLAVSGASNVTGYVPPIHKLARLAHDAEARILVDAAQLYAHRAIDVKRDDHAEHIDFLAAAGHKSYAPFGSAFLIGPRDLLDAAPPYMPGGGTVEWVTEEGAWFSKSPDRHMGGTPNITGTIAFAAATQYLERIGMENIQAHEAELVRQMYKAFAELHDDHGVELLGPVGNGAARDKVGAFSFLVPGHRHEQVATLLDRHYGIATRNGCFCAHPLLHRLLKLGDTSKWTRAISRGEMVELPGATRASLGIYNTAKEVDFFASAVAAIAKGSHGAPSPVPVDLETEPSLAIAAK